MANKRISCNHVRKVALHTRNAIRAGKVMCRAPQKRIDEMFASVDSFAKARFCHNADAVMREIIQDCTRFRDDGYGLSGAKKRKSKRGRR